MEDELDLSLDGKNLGNLRVVDLKQQLERRGLSKSGSKKDLVKRLKSQLEFEKLGEERKLASGGDLKLELDAATEQNEFVQQYLARQQKLLAEQTASAHTSESEEIQNSDEDEKCDSRDGYESNEKLSKVCVNKSSDSEETDISKEQKIVNVKESTDNIEHKADINENLVKKLDTDAIIMPASKDLRQVQDSWDGDIFGEVSLQEFSAAAICFHCGKPETTKQGPRELKNASSDAIAQFARVETEDDCTLQVPD
ncbi:apoptotic chromatin condensation inducer in the nucleus-like [Uloborus diversus]|uniref:apoptotic chromatin condensation inducer in the nucleus-like n=1 Tax=Uloborus diversus TaxID=327109 RepID=UPI00240A2F3B|nr:apoptotic chromatin condensation inducer in the nucleus-like [Uloborus diversus]